ncbi:MAG: replicative DNA helicase [Gammaproteobacteria bacterium]
MRIKEFLANILDMLDVKNFSESQYVGIKSGFNDVDGITLGFKPSDLIVIASRPSLGKSIFVLNTAQNAAINENKKIAFFSLEIPNENIVTRLLSSLVKIPIYDLKDGRLLENDFARLTRKIHSIKNMAIHFNDSPTISISEICDECRVIKYSDGLDFVVVDYLQLISIDDQYENRIDELSEISRKLKSLAVELDIPIIIVSQLNRQLEKRENKRPILSDLRGTGVLAQLADMILFIYRDEVYDEDSNHKGIAEIIIGRNRFGSTGTVNLSFNGQYMRFETL